MNRGTQPPTQPKPWTDDHEAVVESIWRNELTRGRYQALLPTGVGISDLHELVYDLWRAGDTFDTLLAKCCHAWLARYPIEGWIDSQSDETATWGDVHRHQEQGGWSWASTTKSAREEAEEEARWT